jgi:hypothetical protein
MPTRENITKNGRLKMSDLTSEQVDAITHAWLDLCASKRQFERDGDGEVSERRRGYWHEVLSPDPPFHTSRKFAIPFLEAQELAIACRDSVEELEEAFPFLMEGVEEEIEDE